MKGRKQYCFGSCKFAGVQTIGRGGLNSSHILPRTLSKVLQVSQGGDRDMQGCAVMLRRVQRYPPPLKLLLPGKTSPTESPVSRTSFYGDKQTFRNPGTVKSFTPNINFSLKSVYFRPAVS